MARPPKPEGTRNPKVSQLQPGSTLEDDIPPTHYELIGAVIAQWSRMEGVIQELIWKFLNLSIEDGRIITCQNDVSKNLAILRELLKRRLAGSPLLAAFSIRLDRLTQLMEQRNLVAHGLWARAMPENVPGVLSLRRKTPDLGLIAFDRFSTDYLRKLIKAIDDEKAVWKGLCDSSEADRDSTASTA
jgi:hypothetical protein